MQLQNRIVELQRQLEQLRMKLQGNPAGMSFKSVLTELDKVNVGFNQLHKEIRPHLQFYVAHPQHLGQDDVVSTFQVIRVEHYIIACDDGNSLSSPLTADGSCPLQWYQSSCPACRFWR